MNSRILAALFLVSVALSCTDALQLAFSARDLPNRDPFNGAPDGYINVYYAPNPQTQYVYIGRTDDISDNRNPDWPEIFTFTYNGGTAQRLKIDLYDADWPDADDYMGNVEFALSDIVNAWGGTLTLNLIGGNPEQGQLIVKLTSPKPGDSIIDADVRMEKQAKLQEMFMKNVHKPHVPLWAKALPKEAKTPVEDIKA